MIMKKPRWPIPPGPCALPPSSAASPARRRSTRGARSRRRHSTTSGTSIRSTARRWRRAALVRRRPRGIRLRRHFRLNLATDPASLDLALPPPNPDNPANMFYPGGGPIQPGDEILLMSGNYGDISIGDWSVGVNNSSFVPIAAAPGNTPVLSMLAATASSYFMFSGIKVEGTADSSPVHARFPLVQVSGSPALRARNGLHEHARLVSGRHVWLDAGRVASAETRHRDCHPGGRQHNLRLGDEFTYI